MTAVIGASGSGKTTLLQILGTLDQPSGGELFYRDRPLLKKSSRELAAFRNASVGFIFQFHHLLADFTTLENVMMPALIGGKNKKEMVDPARKLLESVELGHRLDHKVGKLIGRRAAKSSARKSSYHESLSFCWPMNLPAILIPGQEILFLNYCTICVGIVSFLQLWLPIISSSPKRWITVSP